MKSYNEIEKLIEEAARVISRDLDMDILWSCYIVNDFVPEAKRLNSHLKNKGYMIFDRRTRGGKYIAQKEKEFYTKEHY